MNRIETILVNSPPRRWLQRTVEARILQQLGGRMAGGTALEIGCGQGAGIELILDRFGADRVIGIELDEKMVARARRRLADHGERADVRIGDAEATGLPDVSADAVFDFGIVHHIPDWHAAVAEVARVLRPGGRFYFVEVTRHALDRATYRTLFDHPEDDRFSADEFVAGLEAVGLRVADRYRTYVGEDYVAGVAERTTLNDSGAQFSFPSNPDALGPRSGLDA
jgi:ubiquinone/menaquinone biosynthesis C-methylase UbiE